MTRTEVVSLLRTMQLHIPEERFGDALENSDIIFFYIPGRDVFYKSFINPADGHLREEMSSVPWELLAYDINVTPVKEDGSLSWPEDIALPFAPNRTLVRRDARPFSWYDWQKTLLFKYMYYDPDYILDWSVYGAGIYTRWDRDQAERLSFWEVHHGYDFIPTWPEPFNTKAPYRSWPPPRISQREAPSPSGTLAIYLYLCQRRGSHVQHILQFHSRPSYQHSLMTRVPMSLTIAKVRLVAPTQ